MEERTRALLDRDNIARWESIRQKENQVRRGLGVDGEVEDMGWMVRWK